MVCALSINWSTAYVHTSTFEAWPRANALALVGSLVLGVCAALVGSLWALHTYLALTNQTTWELLRRCAYRLSPPPLCLPRPYHPHTRLAAGTYPGWWIFL